MTGEREKAVEGEGVRKERESQDRYLETLGAISDLMRSDRRIRVRLGWSGRGVSPDPVFTYFGPSFDVLAMCLEETARPKPREGQAGPKQTQQTPPPSAPRRLDQPEIFQRARERSGIAHIKTPIN